MLEIIIMVSIIAAVSEIVAITFPEKILELAVINKDDITEDFFS